MPVKDTIKTDVLSFKPGQFATFLTNHDIERTMTTLGKDFDKARLAASILLTLPGVPFIYYGRRWHDRQQAG